MNTIEYVSFDKVSSSSLLPIVNEQVLRRHLVDHPLFDAFSIKEWIADKLITSALPGCRIRAVYINDELAGWCGIQPDDLGFEVAVVISKTHWGAGVAIFNTLMCWAKEMGHSDVVFHLLDSRREYKALSQKAVRTLKTELMGRCFTTYVISVDRWHAQ